MRTRSSIQIGGNIVVRINIFVSKLGISINLVDLNNIMSCVANILANLLLRPPRYDYDDLKNLRIYSLIQQTIFSLMQE